jgi:hypothetical protein
LIRAAKTDGSITGTEATAIVSAAETALTTADAKAIVEAYEVPKRMFTLAVGEGPGYHTTPDADKAFDAFFAKASLPVGDGADAVLGRLSSLISFKKLTNQLDGKAMAAPPANLGELVQGRLTGPQRTPTAANIYVDAGKREFFYSEQLLTRIFPQPVAQFYGPFSVDEPVPAIGVPGFGGPQPLPGVGQPGGAPV